MTLPYDGTPDPDFRAEIKHFRWEPWKVSGVQIGWFASGTCPTCRHAIALYRRSAFGFLPKRPLAVACNCTEAHPGRPEGVVQGCGQSTVIAPAEWGSVAG